MRRTRENLEPLGMARTSSPPMTYPLAALDWEKIIGPSCCVCGEVYAGEAGEETGSKRGAHGPSLRGGGGGGAGGGEESFVVLPDSTPVLSEDYFTLGRNPGNINFHGSSSGLAVASSSSSSSTATAAGGLRFTGGGASVGGVGGVGGLSLAPGSELLESGYSGFGGGSGRFGGGWAGGSFGAGSSMLDSIVQISHAGLSDNVRRESLLYDLSKRPARRPRGAADAGKASQPRAAGGEVDGEGGGGVEGDEHDPTLCCHCYASLLEQIDEDTRLAEREALAYRDFVELLDGISAAEDGSGGDYTAEDGAGATAKTNGEEQAAAAEDPSDTPPAGPGDRRKESPRDRSARGPPSSPAELAQQRRRQGEEVEGSEQESPFAQALRIAQHTSSQLRAELRSLEAQRGALCARGSEAWAALSELAYARGVLGDECRELLQVSKEVAENAAHLSGGSALSELFTIQHVDGFPSINGYRLGRAPDDKRRLHWNEINAAWGEAVLLVRCVSSAVDFHSLRFRLVPLNCASRVIELASGDDGSGASQGGGGGGGEDGKRGRVPESSSPSSSSAANATSVVVVCAHDLFSNGGGGSGGGGGGSGSGGRREGDEKHRYLAAVRAFLAASTEAIAFVERRVLERRLEGELSAGAACVASSDVKVPYKQTEDAVGGVSIGSLKSRAAWKAWLCQLVQNLKWAVDAASSLCVA